MHAALLFQRQSGRQLTLCVEGQLKEGYNKLFYFSIQVG